MAGVCARDARTGGTCIEEKFSPKGPVRFWWTPEDVTANRRTQIIDWFTMRKGVRFEPFILWCRERYTSADGGSAVLVDTWGVPKREIYALWSECRSESRSGTRRWSRIRRGGLRWRRRRSCRGGPRLIAVRDEPGLGKVEFRFLRGLHLHGSQLHQHIGLDVHRRAEASVCRLVRQ